MKIRLFVLAMLALLITTPVTAGAGDNGAWQYPEIDGFGRMQPLPEAVNQPSPDKVHKALFDVTKPSKDKNKPNPGLDHVARAVNVFASADVPRNKRDFVVVIHGPATVSVLNDAQYEKHFDHKNPNRKLIAALREAGVTVHVCGQALAEHGFEQSWVDSNVDVALSALSDLVIYGNRGYPLVPL